MLYNKTRRKRIAERIRVCRNFLCKGTGLMFRKRPDYALVFVFGREKIIPLTNFFVFYPIDVLFLDAQMRVAEVKHGFKPFTNYTPKARAKYVVELDAGLAKGVRVGDALEVRGAAKP